MNEAQAERSFSNNFISRFGERSKERRPFLFPHVPLSSLGNTTPCIFSLAGPASARQLSPSFSVQPRHFGALLFDHDQDEPADTSRRRASFWCLS